MPLSQEGTSTEELLERAASGATDALAELFHSYSAEVHRTAYFLTLSADDAEDVVQDVFIGLPEALAAFSGDGSFAGWLRAVTIRTTLMRLRAGRRREATAIRATPREAAVAMQAGIDRLAIEAALAALPADLRTVFVLRVVEGYSHAEIATLLGIRKGTSEVRFHRARRRLRDLLEET
jgi:RNA polymerase sigma-70 factor (ECF subfamily)